MPVEKLTIDVTTNADQAAAKLTSLSKALDGVQNAARNTGGTSGKVANDIHNVGNAAKRATGPLANFVNSLKRIAFYRFIRGIIKSITQAFQEGLEWAYQFSAGIEGEGGRFAAAMDSIKTASTTMKAQLGSAFIGLLTALEPVILQLINLVTQLADALSQIFAAFTGGNYLKATGAPQKWANGAKNAAGAAKEWKNQLLGFDEINRLNEKTGGGGGTSSGINPFDLFSATELSGWAKKLQNFISGLKITWDNVFFDWDDLTGEQIAEKVIVGLAGITGAAVGFMIGGVPGAVVGTLIGVALGLIFSNFIFDNDGELSRNEILAMVCVVAGALVGGIVGFSVGGVGGALIGAAIGAGLTMLITSFVFGSENTEGKRWEILQTLVATLAGLAGGAIGFMVGGPLGGAIGAAIGIGLSLLIVDSVFDGDGNQLESMMQTLVDVLVILAGGAIGFVVGGPAGALIGATVGLGLSLAINHALFNGDEMSEAKFQILQTLVAALGAIVGGIIGFSVGGPLGAVIGAVIGVGVTLAATSLMWQPGTFSGVPAGTPSNATVYPNGGGISLYASGGFPEQGSLFFANEAGPELVGTIGGRTAVASQSDIVDGIRSGVYEAVTAANNGGQDVSVRVYLDSREIRAGQQRVSRAAGV